MTARRRGRLSAPAARIPPTPTAEHAARTVAPCASNDEPPSAAVIDPAHISPVATAPPAGTATGTSVSR
ncbi:hypothetical protein PYK79_42315 [Streptomyces sp. ID05-04B]|nr:hypothetical protein [Streptomyces sp. ID05-04B]